MVRVTSTVSMRPKPQFSGPEQRPKSQNPVRLSRTLLQLKTKKWATVKSEKLKRTPLVGQSSRLSKTRSRSARGLVKSRNSSLPPNNSCRNALPS